MNKQLPINIRPATQEDVGFIFNAWLKSYRNSNFARQLSNTIYFAEHHKVIERLLRNYTTVIACNPEDPEQIYGFINAGFTDNIFTLNYVYIKHPFRKMGIAKELFNVFEHSMEYASIYTHKTRVAEKLEEKYNMIHHPYVAFKNETIKDKN